MDWLTFILTLFGGSLVSLLTAIFYFQPRLKTEQAKAKQAEAAALQAETTAKKETFAFFEERISSLENFNKQQGKALDDVRKELLDLSQAKLESDKRILELEAENKSLKKELAKIKGEVSRRNEPSARPRKTKVTADGYQK